MKSDVDVVVARDGVGVVCGVADDVSGVDGTAPSTCEIGPVEMVRGLTGVMVTTVSPVCRS